MEKWLDSLEDKGSYLREEINRKKRLLISWSFYDLGIAGWLVAIMTSLAFPTSYYLMILLNQRMADLNGTNNEAEELNPFENNTLNLPISDELLITLSVIGSLLVIGISSFAIASIIPEKAGLPNLFKKFINFLREN